MSESVPPADRAEAEEEWSYKRLLYTGRDVVNIGKGQLVLCYAGVNPQRIKITCHSGKSAKRTQILLRRDLRAAQSDMEYNKVLDAFLRAIKDAQREENW